MSRRSSIALLMAVSCALVAPRPAGAQGLADEPWGSEGTWAFQPGNEYQGGPLDLRGLNEKVAGQDGFVRLSPDGNGFVLGSGEPVRFWGVAAAVNPKVSDEDLRTHGRFLARMGVNMVRVGGANSGLIGREPGSKITDVNREFLNDVWRTIAAMKPQGIYTRIAPFWDHGSVKYVNEDWGIEGYGGKKTSLNGLLFFEPTLQKGYKAWMKTMLTEKNPYTGIPIKDDPAVAVIQIVSEDSLLFYWLNGISGGPLKRLQGLFYDFATEKYGSGDKALAAWDSAQAKGDDLPARRLGLYGVHELAQQPEGGKGRRLRDQAEFLARLERDFYMEMKRYLKEECGAKQLITASNMGSASDIHLDDLQRWAWSACDVIERNDFFSTHPKGKQSFWRIDPGHVFEARSALASGEIPALKKQVPGRPFIVSSTSWVPPNPYSAEGPILNSVYASLGGVDGLLWFSARSPGYDTEWHMKFFKGNPLFRWSISHPGFMSQFPAAALIFRKGLIPQGPVVLHEQRSLEELFQRNAPLVTESLDYDPGANLDAIPAGKHALAGQIDSRCYLAGRVTVGFGSEGPGSKYMQQGWSVDDRAVTSAGGGHLQLDTEKKLLRIDAPRAQGAAGFLKAAGGVVKLTDLTLRSQNDYACLLAVPLDDKPLALSQKVLIQVGTIAWPTGWQTEPAEYRRKGKTLQGRKILSTGRMPYRFADTRMRLEFANRSLTRAVRLDEMGFEAQQVPVEVPLGRGPVRVKLPANTLYLILSSEG